jgi:hypothetical protein
MALPELEHILASASASCTEYGSITNPAARKNSAKTPEIKIVAFLIERVIT